eukprot:SAG22_NODE_512_length_9579_cov_27.293143_4_plen_129_part_00
MRLFFLALLCARATAMQPTPAPAPEPPPEPPVPEADEPAAQPAEPEAEPTAEENELEAEPSRSQVADIHLGPRAWWPYSNNKTGLRLNATFTFQAYKSNHTPVVSFEFDSTSSYRLLGFQPMQLEAPW